MFSSTFARIYIPSITVYNISSCFRFNGRFAFIRYWTKTSYFIIVSFFKRSCKCVCVIGCLDDIFILQSYILCIFFPSVLGPVFVAAYNYVQNVMVPCAALLSSTDTTEQLQLVTVYVAWDGAKFLDMVLKYVVGFM